MPATKPKPKPSDLPNLLRCVNTDCGWTEDLTPEHELPARCPECESPATVRCGSSPRPKYGRDHRCRMFVKRGWRCKRHGRNSLKGPDSPSWKDGSRSRYARVPARYRRAVEEAMDDPLAQREMRMQLALLDAMQAELLDRLGSGESGEAWTRVGTSAATVRSRLKEIRRAGEAGDSRRAGRLARDLLSLMEDDVLPLMEGGAGEESARRELVDLMVKRARLLRVQQQGEQTVPVAVLAALQARFAYLATKYFADLRTLALFVAELREAEFPGWTSAEPVIRRLTQAPGEKPS